MTIADANVFEEKGAKASGRLRRSVGLPTCERERACSLALQVE